MEPAVREKSFRKVKRAGSNGMLAVWILAASVFAGLSSADASAAEPITPNQFEGSDSDRIEAAISAARGTTNKIVIPSVNAATGTDLWLIDRAILLPSDMTVILDNCTIQLSDLARDNWFRSDNVGMGITEPEWNRNIAIIGIGKAVLKAAEHPRSTGDYGRRQVLENFVGRVSYGTDAGKEGVRPFGDWRNIGILMAQVDGFTARNFHIKNAHAWAMSFERVHNAELSDLIIENHPYRKIDGKMVYIANCDGINLRQGNKNFRISNITGATGDDTIALTSLDIGPRFYGNGLEHSMLVTTRQHRGPIDATENIHITNVSSESECNAIAIRANLNNRIRNVFIDGLYYKGLPNRNLRMKEPWKHPEGMPAGKNAILVGGSQRGAAMDPLFKGDPNVPEELKEEGGIRGIYAKNVIAHDAGRGLATIKGLVHDVVFANGLHVGGSDEAVTYFDYPTYLHTREWDDESIVVKNIVKAGEPGDQHYLFGPEPVKLSNFVTIGRPGNAADAAGYGAVAYPYQISKYAVSIVEWGMFCGAEESGRIGEFSKDYGYWNAGPRRVGWMGTRHPAVNISFHQAAQYCNWLTTGNAAQGVYAIDENGKVTGVNRAFRNSDGLAYVLPTENEWYKAAYFKPDGSGYSLYADGTGTIPEKSEYGFKGWNYGSGLDPDHPISPAHKGSEEQNGTYNMMGMVWEWVEDSSGTARGGAYNLDESFMASSFRLTSFAPEAESTSLGFRVIAIK